MRARRSTVGLAVVFLVALVTYLFVRPEGPETRVVAPVQTVTPSSTPSPTTSPTPSPTPTDVPEPTEAPSAEPSDSAGPSAEPTSEATSEPTSEATPEVPSPTSEGGAVPEPTP